MKRKSLTTIVITLIFSLVLTIPVSAETSKKFKLTGKYNEKKTSTILNWTEYEGAEYYKIQIKRTTDKKWVTIFDYYKTSNTFIRPEDNHKYSYRIVAVKDGKGYSSNKVTIKGTGKKKVDDGYEYLLYGTQKKAETSKPKTVENKQANESTNPNTVNITITMTGDSFTSTIHDGNEQNNQKDDVDTAAMAREVFELVNIEREKAGVAPLTWDTSLESAAEIRAVELNTLFSHTRPNGTDFYTAIDSSIRRNTLYGENAHAGSSTAKKAMENWLNSPGHKANILNSDYKSIVVACYYDSTYSNEGYGYNWVQIFSK